MEKFENYSKKSKIDFMLALVKEKNILSSDKERMFSLIINELHVYDFAVESLLDEIQMIKEVLGINAPLLDSDLPDYINPIGNSKFLMAFNQNPILKSTTHKIDSNQLELINEHLKANVYNFSNHLSAIHNEFNKLNTRFYKKTSKGLSAKMHAYLFGKKTWSSEKIDLSWSSTELKEWAENNPGKCPNPEEDLKYKPFTFYRIKLKNGYIRNMCDVVLLFKQQVTIREDNNLENLCKNWSENDKERVNFSFDKIDNKIELFTDVEKLGQAYVKIIKMCIDASKNDKPEIELELKQLVNQDGSINIFFSIYHKNSVFKKTIEQTKKRYGSFFTGLISEQINGLCDWRLSADFGNQTYAQFSIWPKDDKTQYLEKFEGVKYELIFSY